MTRSHTAEAAKAAGHAADAQDPVGTAAGSDDTARRTVQMPRAGWRATLRARLTGGLRQRADWSRLTAVWHKHWLFALALAAAAAPRVISMLGFRPALFLQDSFGYLRSSEVFAPNQVRPAGYSGALLVLSPLHSLDVVTGLQHLAGLGIATAVYAMLRRWGLPGWGATLAVAPTLFDPRQIWLEQSILPDTMFEVLLVAAVLVLLTPRKPAAWRAALAGLAVGLASITRGNGIALLVVVVGYLLIRRVKWRAVGAAVLACAIPVGGYLLLFHIAQGPYALSNSDGMFLWARTMSFANCAKIKPPPDLVPLCRENQPYARRAPAPNWSWGFLVTERPPADYLWTKRAWWRVADHPGFTVHNNHLALQFAIKAISAQPLDYGKVTARDVALTFLNTDGEMKFAPSPHIAQLSRADVHAVRTYAHTGRNTHLVQPWAFLMFGYQQPTYFSGVLFFLVMLAGLGGVIWNWRRWGGPALLPWVTAAAVIVVPVALAQYSYRYAIPAVSLACMAAALAVTRGRRVAADRPWTWDEAGS